MSKIPPKGVKQILVEVGQWFVGGELAEAYLEEHPDDVVFVYFRRIGGASLAFRVSNKHVDPLGVAKPAPPPID